MWSGPGTACHGEVLRWHDHWLKGIDTGVTQEPPVKYWLMGANEWRTRQRLADARRRSGPSSISRAGSG